MSKDLINILKIGMAVLFLLCLLDMPYGYYMMVRTVGMIGFVLLAYNALQDDDIKHVILYAGLAILFQPLHKIALGRTLWNIVDVVVAVYLIYTLTTEKKEQ